MPPPVARTVSFGAEVQPILERSCVNCHGHGRAKGGFQLDSRDHLLKGGDSGAAAVPGNSSASLLIQLVSGVDPDNVMPKKGSRLTPEQVGVLRAWIDQGLPWDPGISFARKAPLNLLPKDPPARPGSSAENPIDQILAPYFQHADFTPPPVVDDAVFARRVYLDVIGLLPTPQELDAFVASMSSGKRGLLVTELLGRDRQYAEHWLSLWNDLLRNDYRGTGYIDGGRKQITAWLYSALLTNMPYDRFVAELVNPSPESEGFSKGIVWRGVVNSSQTPEMQAAQNISQVFMGVNLKCASCHDSFINDWRLADAYGMAAIYSDGPLEMFQCDKPTGKRAAASFIYPELGEMSADLTRSDRLKRLAALMTSPQNGRLTRTIVNRLWSRFFGHGLVEPVDDMEQPAWNSELLDWLAQDLAAHHYDLKRTIAVIASSRAYQLPTVPAAETKPYVFRGPAVRRLSAEQFRDALGRVTGVWFDKAEFQGGNTNEVRAALVAADPLMTALGRPNREQVITVRASTATTLQALELSNGETLTSLLQDGAQRLISDGSAPEHLVRKVYRAALGRFPTDVEAKSGTELLGNPATKEGAEDLLWAIAMLPEFQLIY